MGECRADQAVNDALHGRAHDSEQVPGARPGETFGDPTYIGCHLPAVAVEEEDDEYTETELEKAGAEHRPAGYGDVGGGADQLLELSDEGGRVVGQALPIGSEALANQR